MRPIRLICAVAAVCLVSLLPAAAEAGTTPALRDVLLVGNNWDGTADVLDVPSYERIRRINIVPDLAERQAENLLPTRAPFAIFVRTQVGEGHDQMVDDLYASKDGRTLYVSRPSFDDVVAIDLASGRIVWRTVLTGVRADHMAISPDGARLAVSTASAAGPSYVDVLDTATGALVGTFPSGDTPHENNYSRDGNRIYHASIGRIYTAADDPALDASKGDRVFEIVDAHSLQVLKKWNMAEKLAEAGYPGMSASVRPMALSPDEKWLYFQVSFFHGFVEFDLEHEKVTRVAHLPTTDATPPRREDYILDSAHHGIAMNGAGTKLCVAGTMSNYAGIVHRDDFSYRIHPLGARTYWSTTSADGHYCYVSVAGDDSMSIISYDSEQEVARVPVGDHPQRARVAKVSTEIFGAPASAGRLKPRSLSLHAARIGGRTVRVFGRLALPASVEPRAGCRGIVRVDLRRKAAIVLSLPARLQRRGASCTFARSVRVPARVSRPVRLGVHARFPGNSKLMPARARSRSVRLR
jgi:DNA-binding beta-propeller fold protein YncE